MIEEQFIQTFTPDIFWIPYLMNPVNEIQAYSWPYFYPTNNFLIEICNANNLPFYMYPFQGCEDYFNVDIYSARKLLTVKVYSDIHSGFRSLAYLITGSEHNYSHIRNLLQQHYQQINFPEKFYAFFGEQISTVSFFLRECDLIIAANLFQLNIIVFNYRLDEKWYLINESWFSSIDNMKTFIVERPSILLCFDGYHFYSVLAVMH